MPIKEEELEKLLHEANILDESHMKAIFVVAKEKHLDAEQYLCESGLVSEEQLGQLLAQYYSVRYVNLKDEVIPEEVIKRIPEIFAKEQQILPYKETGDVFVVATSDPNQLFLKSLLEKYVRKPVEFVYATRSSLKDGLHAYQKNPQTMIDEIISKRALGSSTDQSIVNIVNVLFDSAYYLGASDIHIEPEEHVCNVRFRIDGVLHEVAMIPSELEQPILTRIKVLSLLPTDEHRSSLDGKIHYQGPWGEPLDIRVSIIPTVYGENVVMRLLSEKSQRLMLQDLGMNLQDLQKYEECIKRPWGMVLVTGPTGSGKTTSLYAALRLLNKPEVNITTIEDPVEYHLDGINQIQVNEKTNLTFAKGLRSIVRQDPNVIMVGEIRDEETANIAVNAAMTGHIVLSTLHTNDASTAFPRLVDMGVENFLIASTVNAVIAQRLVRKICNRCIHSYVFDDSTNAFLNKAPVAKEYIEKISGKKNLKTVRLYRGMGCDSCVKSGYHGRVGIFEVLKVDDGSKVREAIMNNKNADEIRNLAIQEGMTTMLFDGINKALSGQTTLEEVLRVSME